MSNTEPVQEPSMDEILASIRKIISDDDSSEAEQQANGEAEGDALAEAPGEAQEADPEPVEIEEPAVVEDPAEVPVTEEKNPQVEEPAAMAIEEVPVMEPEPEPVLDEAPAVEASVDAMEDEDVLELGEDLALDSNPEASESAADMAMEQADPGTDIPADVPDIVEADDEIEFVKSSQAAEPTDEPVQGKIPAEIDSAPETELLAEDQGASIASAFGSLENLVLANEEKTLDGLVREMLKPMLKNWLDANLAPLVDRMVRDEIERVSRGRR